MFPVAETCFNSDMSISNTFQGMKIEPVALLWVSIRARVDKATRQSVLAGVG